MLVRANSSFRLKPTLVNGAQFIEERDRFWSLCAFGQIEEVKLEFSNYSHEPHVQKVLVTNKVEQNLYHPIHIATENRHYEMVFFLLKEGKTDVNVKDKVSTNLCPQLTLIFL